MQFTFYDSEAISNVHKKVSKQIFIFSSMTYEFKVWIINKL